MSDTTTRDKKRAEIDEQYVGVVDHGQLTIYDETECDTRWITSDTCHNLEDLR